MAELVNFAGDGLPLYLWAMQAGDGQSPWDVGIDRARRGIGGFAREHTVVREIANAAAACLIGYPLGDSPQLDDKDEVSNMLRPLLELEGLVPGTWYVNVLATVPEHRGNGYGAELLRIGETIASDASCTGMSLIVSDANVGARRLYKRLGYSERATRPMVKEKWQHEGKNWALLVKDH